MKIKVNDLNNSPQKIKIKNLPRALTKFELIEELLRLDKEDFKQVVRAAKRLRLANQIAQNAIGGLND